ncbi:glycosyltransferase family 2 protein [Flavitalea flava]
MKRIIGIIVTYNGLHWIERCLRSLTESSYPCQIIVVDNGSTDTTTSFIKREFPGVTLIETGKNLGFGQANNRGLKIALDMQAEYIFLLNQDAWVESDTLSSLVAAQLKNPAYGIVSPTHLNGKGVAMDRYFLEYFRQSGINGYLNKMILRLKDESRCEQAGASREQAEDNLLIDTTFVNAAAWLITRECLQKVGGFDPIFFHYGEDRNYTQRVLFKGFKIGIHLYSRICHDREDRIREDRISEDRISDTDGNRVSDTVADKQYHFKKEWEHFLNQVCDIRRPGYKSLIFRRFLRYSLLTGLHILYFNKTRLLYNYGMAKKILFSIPRIHRSRSRSQAENCSQYL